MGYESLVERYEGHGSNLSIVYFLHNFIIFAFFSFFFLDATRLPYFYGV